MFVSLWTFLIFWAGAALCGSAQGSVGDGLSDERLGRLEKLLTQQQQHLQLLEAEKLQLQDNVQLLSTQLSALKSENRELKDEVSTLNAANRAFQSLLGLGVVYTKSDDVLGEKLDVYARSDDPNQLEPVMAQLSQKLTEVSAEVEALKNVQAQLGVSIQAAGNSAYTHWGSSTCPNSTELVYSGVIGGSYFNHAGAATNYLCLSMSPIFSDHATPGAYASLWGAEYETYDEHFQKDPVCAVCRSQRATTIMVPGTNVCLPGWSTEYSGYLMAGHYGHGGGSEFICVDSKLESRNAGYSDENGRLLYYTLTQCGSLPCEPYVNQKIVTCAVCSK